MLSSQIKIVQLVFGGITDETDDGILELRRVSFPTTVKIADLQEMIEGLMPLCLVVNSS